MAKTDPINTANPAGSASPKQGDDIIRTLARAVAEILGVDHYVGASSPYNEDAAGEHAKVTLNAVLGADPDPGAGKGALYIKTVNAKSELFYEDADDNAIQLTSGGEVLFGSLSSIAKDTYLKAIDNAGTGTIDLIKGNASDKAILKVGAELSTNAEPGTDAGIANKKYVDDQIAAMGADDDAFGSWTNKDSGGSANLAKDEVYKVGSDGFVLAYFTGSGTSAGYTDGSNPPTAKRAQNIGGEEVPGFIMLPVKKDDYWKITGTTTIINWLPIGSGTCVKQ